MAENIITKLEHNRLTGRKQSQHINKELLKLEQMTKKPNRKTEKQDMNIALKNYKNCLEHIKQHSNSPIIREMQIKTIQRYYFTFQASKIYKV